MLAKVSQYLFHFIQGKVWFEGLYICFLTYAQNIILWVFGMRALKSISRSASTKVEWLAQIQTQDPLICG